MNGATPHVHAPAIPLAKLPPVQMPRVQMPRTVPVPEPADAVLARGGPAASSANPSPAVPAGAAVVRPMGHGGIGVHVDVLSGEGAEFALPQELRSLACYLSDGRLLVSRSHQNEPRITAYAARLERLGRTVLPLYVELAAIQTAYADARERSAGGTPVFTASAMQAHAMQLFRRAAQRSASDIHVRVIDGQATQVLFRILGDLRLVEEQSAAFGSALCSTIYQAMTDQSDATFVPSQPQDGRVSNPHLLPPSVSGVRVATTAQVGGHVMVLRLLYKSSRHGTSLHKLGFSQAQLECFARLRRRPTGIIVNSGPTGAGKSTTLQCALNEVLAQTGGKRHVITVEDPPEYPIPGAVQTPVVSGGTEEGRAIAFQQAIRAAMRLDPDIIMIGEMRDGPSARLAVAAAMTGHQVWTTLHANHALDIIERLVDLGVPQERLLNESVVAGLVAQRLVKTLCPACRVPFAQARQREGLWPAEELDRMASVMGDDIVNACLHGPGCVACEGSGYVSRTVLAEVVETSAAFMAKLRAGDRDGAHALWKAEGGMTLAEHARAKIAEGLVDPFDAEEHVAWS
ncbi:MAG: Flp pilus assembly complex ATPase component TadA [Burkholderiaceae bacterium]|nr:Flp pilus assembly complex ATPase component TadA [Burkholderiaceae bacterium]